MSSRQRQQEKKIRVLQTWRRAHSYLSERYYILFCCYCCCWTKWETFQFEMLPWISVSTVKLVKSKHCSIHRRKTECTVGALSKWTVHTDTNFGLHTDVHSGVHMDPCEPSWTWVDDDFYVTHTKAERCECTDAESMIWPLGEVCSCVAAKLYAQLAAVNKLSGTTCTDEACVWNNCLAFW